jgi:hypothetical protein
MGTYLGKQTNAKKILTEKKKPKLILTKNFICIRFSIPLLNSISVWRSFNHLSILSVFQLTLISILILYSLVIYFIVFFSSPLLIRFIFHLSISLCNLIESASWYAHNKKFQWLFLSLGKPPWLAKLYWLWFSTQICNINFSNLRHTP